MTQRAEEAEMTEQPEYGERTDPDFEPQPGEGAELESPSTDDPDLQAARAMAPTQDPKTLTTDELQPEEELTEYEPPFEPTPETAFGVTAADERTGETLDERVQQEEPEDPQEPGRQPAPELADEALEPPEGSAESSDST